MHLEVSRLTISEVLRLLSEGKWQIPKFQREFIWTQTQIIELLHSVFRPRPIGLITTWVQPETKPQCEAEPVRLKAAEFKRWKDDPAVVKFVLDGRQRLTTLAIAFGGLKNPDDRYQFSGRWFLNLDAELDSENLFIYRKQRQVKDGKFSNRPICLAHGQIPLDEYKDLKFYNQNIMNKDIYPEGQMPSQECLELRSQRLAQYYDTFSTFQIPVAELPESISLAEVCDIFDVLNTTGTKVSTFDLIHNLIFSDTGGEVNMRERFHDVRENFSSFALLCDPDRPEYFCQIVTGCYIVEPNPLGRKKTRIQSIKGGDLIETTFEVYQKFLDNIARLDSYASDLFSDVLGTRAPLNKLAYPVSLILYLALRWRSDMVLKVPTERVNQIFRAFYWRNTLASRYDQGYLTLFATDLTGLIGILTETAEITNWASWCKEANDKLDSLFGSQYRRLEPDRIKEVLLDGELFGAMKQGLSLFLAAKVRTDLVDGEQLDRNSADKAKSVQLHHIFPADWCRNNWSIVKTEQDQSPDKETINCFANLVPMKAESNQKWKAMAPHTAIQTFHLASEHHKNHFEQALIDGEALAVLNQVSADPYRFWLQRAETIARELAALQHVC